MNQMARLSLGEPQAPAWTAGRILSCTLLGAALLAVAGCGSQRVARPAPVEDRGTARSTPAPAPAPGATDTAPRAGYVTVQPGDTLYRIALNAGRDYRDIASWNNISNPNAIEVGQQLRVVPPGASTNGGAAPANGVTTAPVTNSGVNSRPLSETSPVATPAPAPAPAPSPAPAAAAGDEIPFVWPATGAVIANFDENTNKGVSIGGKIGDPVLAAADGRVVYAGAGLRGYGNLIILQHNNTYLTAYAHNQALLVRENQAVKQGQKIAEMGSSDADRVKLHFEVRRLGKPVDPLTHLPKR